MLFRSSKTLGEKVKAIINPPETERAMGVEPKNLFNPLQGGFNFMLVAKVGANGFTNYDSSSVAPESTSIYASKEEAIKDISENCYKLSDWDNEEAYKTYDELKALLDNLENPTQSETKKEEVSATEVSPQTETQSLDELMASLGK